MDYIAFVRRQLAQDPRMNAIMLAQIHCNLDGRAYDDDDLEYTSTQLVERALFQAADYYDITGRPDGVRRAIGAMAPAAASGAEAR